MTATLHSPSAIAPIAWATWYSNEDPPTIVEPRKAGLMPRYSASASTDNRLWADDRRGILVRIPCGPCDGRDCAWAVQRHSHRLWQHTAQHRAQTGDRARDQPIRDPVQAVHADKCICARRFASHA